MGNIGSTKSKSVGLEMDEEQIAGLLSSLKRVEAPGDFDFRVRALIAQGKPASRSSAWLPATVRIAMPLALLVAVGGYFGFNSMYPAGDDIAAPSIAKVQPSETPLVSVANEVVSPSHDEIAKLPSNQLVASHTEDHSTETIPKSTTRSLAAANSNPKPGAGEPDSGSYVEASRDVVILSPVTNNNGSQIHKTGDTANTNAQVTTKVRVKNILAVMGINAVYTAAGWKAVSVSANSLARRSGVKVGDLIMSMNGQPLSAATEFDNGFSGRNLGVNRDGQSLQISLKN